MRYTNHMLSLSLVPFVIRCKLNHLIFAPNHWGSERDIRCKFFIPNSIDTKYRIRAQHQQSYTNYIKKYKKICQQGNELSKWCQHQQLQRQWMLPQPSSLKSSIIWSTLHPKCVHHVTMAKRHQYQVSVQMISSDWYRIRANDGATLLLNYCAFISLSHMCNSHINDAKRSGTWHQNRLIYNKFKSNFNE